VDNTNSGIPAIQGVIILFESDQGSPVALVEAACITALRTAAASGAATREADSEVVKRAKVFVEIKEFALKEAGTADFCGNDTCILPERIRNLITMFRQVFPQITNKLDLDSGLPWAGLRPMSVDGLPFIGPTSVDNLYLNSGHGHLGWTLAVGSGRLLADLITGNQSDIEHMRYAATRI
jgi:FAD dependent oxidoreductase/Ornithine cyclodeaminase/mu-crystallin family